MSVTGVTDDFIALAKVLVDDLASEIDLQYEDNEMKLASHAIEKLQRLQELIGDEPSSALKHIIARFYRSVDACS